MPLTYCNPVLEVDFADPGVFWDDERQLYFGYGTNANGFNVPCCSSPDFCSWQLAEHDALPGPYPPWTGKDGFRCWAPEVRRAPEGRPGYLMYFSTHDFRTGVMSIAVAYSPQSPLGPFAFVGDGPLVSQGDLGGTIDPQPFEDPVSGRTYLLYKNDGNHEQTAETRIWIQELAADGLSVVGEAHAILSPTHPSHKGLIEAPYLVYHRASTTYHLFFSSGFFGNEDYSTGYASSRHLLGPYRPEKTVLLGTDESKGMRGPGGISVIERGPEGHWMLAFHAHDRKGGGGRRQLCVHRLEWTAGGKPVLAGGAAHYGHRLTMGGEHLDNASRTPPSLRRRGAEVLGKAARWVKDY